MAGLALGPRLERHIRHRCKQLLHRRFSSSSSIARDGVETLLSSDLPKPRLDYRSISENALYKSHNAFNRKSPLPIGAVQNVGRLYAEWKNLSSELNSNLHTRSTIGDRIRDSSGETKARAKEEAKALKASIGALELRLGVIENEMHQLALSIPNDTHPDVPIGPEDAAVTLSTYGPPPIPASSARDHTHIGKVFNLIDFESAATVTGSSWYYLLNEGVLLELALTQYAMSKAIARGFTPVTAPDVVKADVATRCGFQPRDAGDPPVQQMYHLQRQTPSHPELLLSGTAEIPLAGMCANKVFREEQFPLKFICLGRAFRSEAGARGADTRGLYRVHQFTKLELFAVCGADQSENLMQEMLDLQKDLFTGLNLPLRVLDMPTEELGASAYRKYDIEAWMPGRGRWGEISSTSNCTDFQARRLHIRYRRRIANKMDASTDACSASSPSPDEGPLPFAHTLNGTAAAIPRLIIALLENGVQFDEQGNIQSLTLPLALKPFWLSPMKEDIISWI